MASTINGTSTGSGGLISTGDDSGILNIQTNETTAITVDASQNVTLAGTLTTSSRGIAKASMPTGSVLQVVQASYSSASNSTSTYADTGLTATITPSSASNKVLIIVSHNGVSKNISGTGSGVNIRLLNGASVISTFAKLVGFTNTNSYNVGFSVGVNYLDSPGVTSAVTYKTQFANDSNVASVEVGANAAISYMTLMEISA